ncbi:MAG: hypothetical protein V3V72_13420 [Ignavibacteriaceae bacterium]
MINNTLEAFQKWNDITDYESDEITVTLINNEGKKEAEFNYPKFTKADFEYFKAVKNLTRPGFDLRAFGSKKYL